MTYKRSREARQEEAVDGGDIYARVYSAERPEIFYKAHGSRVVGPFAEVGIRRDSAWNVPEPELALVMNPAMEVVGLTVGNDMSSRDIEGANPLYLPQAKVYTAYPGATPQEVEREVTYHIENAVQQLQQLKRVESISQQGFSEVTVVIKDKYKKPDFPNIWDELRRKITDAQSSLPPGSKTSVVFDDFGDVFGLFYALSGESYTYRELKDYADLLEEQLLLVPGVRKITIDGNQREVIYLDISRAERELGWTPQVEFRDGLAKTVEWFRARRGDLGL